MSKNTTSNRPLASVACFTAILLLSSHPLAAAPDNTDSRFSLRCSRTVTMKAGAVFQGDPAELTFVLGGKPKVYDWTDSKWVDVDAVTESELVIDRDAGNQARIINRITGAYYRYVDLGVGKQGFTESGQCTRIALKIPPKAQF